MAQWLERYLNHDYSIVRRRFVLTEPGFTASSAIASKAIQYVEWTLGGEPQQSIAWFDDDNYQMMLWNVGSDQNGDLIAFVLTRDFVPDTNERTLVGYFHISSLHQN